MPGVASFDIIPAYGAIGTGGIESLGMDMIVMTGGVSPRIKSMVLYAGDTAFYSHFNGGAQFNFSGVILDTANPVSDWYSTVVFSDGSTTWTCTSCYVEEITIGKQDMKNGTVIYPITIAGWSESCAQSVFG